MADLTVTSRGESMAPISAPAEASGPYRIDVKACVRCGSCATIAPSHFVVRHGPAKVLKRPGSAGELRACEAARLVCPTQAILTDAPLAPQPEAAQLFGQLYPTVMDIAEGVRWKMSDLPWSSFDKSKATPGLVAVVREMAYSEQTTFSATERFMAAFGQDPDISQWVSVWFYEETRHPLALLKWLELAGESYDDEFVAKGRVSEPFMKSNTGTLVSNIISEMTAADAYLMMVKGRLEPLLAAIVQRLSSDEARHAASFYTYCHKLIETSENPDRERVEALKVLHFWFNLSRNLNHPVNIAMMRLKTLLPAINAPMFEPPNQRIGQVIGQLIGMPINQPSDVALHMRELTRRMAANPAPSA